MVGKTIYGKVGRGKSQGRRKEAQSMGESILAKQIKERERLCFSEELTQLHGGGSNSKCRGLRGKVPHLIRRVSIHSMA